MWWYDVNSLYHAVTVGHLENRYFQIYLEGLIFSFTIIQAFSPFYKNRKMLLL